MDVIPSLMLLNKLLGIKFEVIQLSLYLFINFFLLTYHTISLSLVILKKIMNSMLVWMLRPILFFKLFGIKPKVIQLSL